MQISSSTNRLIWDNVMWFAGSMALAFFVWVIASLQSDPVQERLFRNIPVQVAYGDGLVITEQSRATVTVTVRGPQSTLDQLDTDDIEVRADLTNLGAGLHRVNLEARVSRRASVDTSPRQITVTLEEAAEQFKPITITTTNAPPAGYEVAPGSPSPDVNQVLVSGPLSKVEQVIAARVTLNLQEQRSSFQGDYRLIPVDIDGDQVSDVTLDPQTVRVTVQIEPRPDIREVRITPNILAETLPDGYALTEISYDPQVILVSGAPERLESAPGTFFTDPIDLAGHTSSFEQDVTVQVPDENLFIVGAQSVRVTIGITPLIASRQFDRIPIQVLGAGEGLTAALAPDEVTVLITGPQLLVQELVPANLRVMVDVTGLSEGNYQLPTEVSINQGLTPTTSLSVLPAEIDVVIAHALESTPTTSP
jgi:YbbR domain-containing protein